MDEQVYNRYYDTGGNYHWTGVHSGEHILWKGEKMTRDEAIAYGKEQLEIFGGTHREFILMAIEALERKHGKNICDSVIGHCEFKCSVCGADASSIMMGSLDGGKFNYCPNCGADMRKESE